MSLVLISDVTTPVVRALTVLASRTVIDSVIVIASLPNPSKPSEA